MPLADGGRAFVGRFDVRHLEDHEGTVVKVTADVQNVGGADAPGVTFELVYAGPALTTPEPMDLPAGSNATFSFQFDVEPAALEDLLAGHVELFATWLDAQGEQMRHRVELTRVPAAEGVQQ
jgi:hypothetical protein